MSTKDDFKRFIFENNVRGSNKASSYVRALDLLGEMLLVESFGLNAKSVWEMDSVDALQKLYVIANEQKHKRDASVWNLPNLSKSYLQNGYCTAAIRSLQEFLVEDRHERELMEIFEKHTGTEEEVGMKLDLNLDYPDCLIDELEGREVARTVNTRVNQGVFRKIVLKIYNQSCCITGLDIPEVNRASHIIPWATNKKTRMDPRNGLCLSATYDAAFDRNLISLDDDYRIILSKGIRDHYTSDAVQAHFIQKEGQTVNMPRSYYPNKDYISIHRSKGDF